MNLREQHWGLATIGEQLFMSAMDALFVLDAESLEILAANPHAARTYGLTEEELLGRTLPSLSRSPEREFEELRGELADVGWDSVHQNSKGQALHVEIRVSELRLEQDRRPDRALLCSVRDHTDRVRVEAQFLQAQKMELVGQLAGGIAHDFRNVLTAVLGFAQLAQAALPDAERVVDNLEGVQSAAARGAALANRLLVFAREDTVQLEPLLASQVLEGLAPMLRRLLPGGVRLEVEVADSVPAVLADPGYLEQVVMNLVINARDACGVSGQIAVRCKGIEVPVTGLAELSGAPPGHWLCLSVEDTGTGISEAVLPRLFEPFFTTKEGARGTGLGLSTVFAIVKRMHGHILVKSRPGEGSRFVVLVPQHGGETAEPAPARQVPVDHEHCGEGLRVLVVEDQAVVRKLVVRILEGKGYSVVACESGDEAMSVNLSDIDVVVCDVLMPGTSGPDAVAAMRAQRPDLRVIFITAYADTEQTATGLVGERVLAKPFKPADLLGQMSAALTDPG